MTEKLHYLYHLRDPETSAGFGFDGYGGTTNDFRRRYGEHMRACAKGRHPNHKIQKLYDDAGGNLKMRIVRVGTKEEVLASEGLVFNRPDKHANIQLGGGHLRGMSEDELIKRSGLGNTHAESLKWRPLESKVSKQQMALIVAAGVAIAAGAYYGYQYYKKRARSINSPTEHMVDNSYPDSTNDEAERQARVAARLAKVRKMQENSKGGNRALLGTFAAYAVLLTAYQIANEE
jgi:hypothetical protein